MKNLLTIAGSDSSGGAGIQADLKTFAANGGYGMSVITAVTAQNTTGVSAVHNIPPEIVRAQIDAVFNDINVDGVKIGMLSTADIANAVADAMEVYKPRILIVDPVMVSTSGSKLLSDEAVEVIKNRLCRLQLWLHRIFPRLNICAGRRLKIFMRWGRQLRLLVIWAPGYVLIKGRTPQRKR